MGAGLPVLVIAELGVNHNGDVALAEELIGAAAVAGADVIKLQAFSADRVATLAAEKAAYQIETTGAQESQHEMLRRLELPEGAFVRLAGRCQEHSVLFLASVFDDRSVRLLAKLDVPAFKVGSGELTNWALLEAIAATGKPVILSTGMADLNEVEEAVGVLDRSGCRDVIVLHCTTNYPASPADANLLAIPTLREALHVPVGYSDHTPGPETALAAVALGACVVEKHFTLDRRLPGPDHRASLEPDDFRRLVDGIRIVSAALGDGRKRPAESELANRAVVRRSLVASRPLAAGTTLAPDMLRALRPGTGIPPTHRDELIGRRLRRSVAADEAIAWSDLE